MNFNSTPEPYISPGNDSRPQQHSRRPMATTNLSHGEVKQIVGKQVKEIVKKSEDKIKKIRAGYDEEIAKIRAEYDDEIAKINSGHVIEINEIEARHAKEIKKIRAEYTPKLAARTPPSNKASVPNTPSPSLGPAARPRSLCSHRRPPTTGLF